MPRTAGFRTVKAMDEKLALLAKCTVFARCSRRELTELGRLVEVTTLPPGAALPASGRGRWTHMILGGRGLAVTDGLAHCLLGEGDRWSLHGANEPTGRRPTGDRLVALTELTVATVESRALATVERCCRSFARVQGIDAPIPSRLEQISSRSAERDRELVGSRSHG